MPEQNSSSTHAVAVVAQKDETLWMQLDATYPEIPKPSARIE